MKDNKKEGGRRREAERTEGLTERIIRKKVKGVREAEKMEGIQKGGMRTKRIEYI